MSQVATVQASPGRILGFAREVLSAEADAIAGLAAGLDERFCTAVDWLLACRGAVIVTGIGKAGLIGGKLAATLASTGTRSHFLHPAEAMHGDLGRIGRDDLLLALSHSGETAEVTQLLPTLRSFQTPLVAITGNEDSTLAHAADIVLPLGSLQEACALGLAPSTSTAAMLALGDALALSVSRQRDFRPEDFARFHPGGSLGRKLARVEEAMRPLADCRVATEAASVREVLVQAGRPGRRTGAIMLIDAKHRLTGIFTDSDLARLFERRLESALDRPMAEVMTREPLTVRVGLRLSDAIASLTIRKISELPVVDAEDRPLGLLDITDLIAAAPPAGAEAPTPRVAWPA